MENANAKNLIEPKCSELAICIRAAEAERASCLADGVTQRATCQSDFVTAVRKCRQSPLP